MSIQLRDLTLADLPHTYRWHSDPQLSEQILSYPPPIEPERERQWLNDIVEKRDSRRVVFGIEDSESHLLLGIVQVHNIDPVDQSAFVGLFLGDKEHRSRGLGSEALRKIIDYVFVDLQLTQIHLEVAIENDNAIAFYRRFGFQVTKEGLTRPYGPHGSTQISIMTLRKPVSLLDLSRQQKSLPPLRGADVHYPAEDLDQLAAVEASHFWFATRRRIVDRMLRDFRVAKGCVGVDVGCGTGDMAAYLTEIGLPTTGVDAHASTKFIHRRAPSGFVQGDIFGVEPVPEFNFALLLDVIEHLDDDLAFVRQTAKFLQPNGLLILSVPALQSLWSSRDVVSGHRRRYSKKDIVGLVAKLSGELRLERQFYFFGATLPLLYLSRLRKADPQTVILAEGHPRPFINKLLQWALNAELGLLPFGGLPLGSSLFVILRKGG
jgi:RimJ/RimL family protein N-acetyltransferase/SAM-dependent methyltransferase